MSARLLIEQRLTDLEITLCRQEELIQSQKQALISIKNLIALELSKAHQLSEKLEKETKPSATPTFGVNVLKENIEEHEIKQVIALPPSYSKTIAINSKPSAQPKLTSIGDKDSNNVLPFKRPRESKEDSVGVPLALSKFANYSVKRRRALDRVRQFLKFLPPVMADSASSSGALRSRATKKKEPISADLLPGEGIKSNRISISTPILISSSNSPHPDSDLIRSIIKKDSSLQQANIITLDKSSPPKIDEKASSSSIDIRLESTSRQSHSPFVPILSVPKSRKMLGNNDTISILQELNQITTSTDRLNKMKDLNTLFRIEPKECKRLLECGAKDTLLIWLAEIETDSPPTSETALLLEYLLKLLSQVKWSQDDVNSSRIDKVLRRIYKKMNPYKEVISEGLMGQIREMWNLYRTMYKLGDED